MRKLTQTLGIIAFCGGFGLPVAAMIQELPSSPMLRTLFRELHRGNHPALETFWRKVSDLGTPLVEQIPGDKEHVLLTFLWRGPDETKNVVVFSVLGDNLWTFSRNQLTGNQMTRLGDSDVWYKSYRARDDVRFTYYLSPNDNLLPTAEIIDWTERYATWVPDPLNPHRQVRPHREKEWIASLVELGDASLQPWSKRQSGLAMGRLEEHVFRSDILGSDRRIWVYVPAVSEASHQPHHLLLMFDGWDFRHIIPTSTILDNLSAAGRIPPLLGVMVEQKDRKLELACHQPFNHFLAKELVPWIREKYEVSSDPSETILAGGSRGGLAAACAALQYPNIFGNVISQSGQFTWPAGDSESEEENEKTDQEYGWLMRQYGTRGRLPIQFYLAVGLLERGPYSFLMANRHLRDVLEAKGYRVYYREFSGGHEDIHWRSTLPEALLALLSTETEGEKGEKSQFE